MEWAIYSNNMDFLKLPVEKLKNKVICDKHFPETSFMNYTRSKLTKTTSVPTIYFNEEEKEIDLLESPTEWCRENLKNRPGTGWSAKPRLELDESSEPVAILNTASVSKRPLETLKRVRSEAATSPKTPEVRILNKLPATTVSLNNQVHSLGEIKQIVKKSPVASQFQAAKKVFSPPEKVRVLSTSSAKIIKQEILPRVVPQSQSEEPRVEVMYSISEMEQVTPVKPEVDYSQEIQSLMKDVSEIKNMLNEKLNQAPTTAQPSTSDSSNITQSQFNKVQLFNGIKRYLSPSLTALLRMEIFAASNREYKRDEKIIAGEILQLGNEVYDFFTDEWRLRLPAKDLVSDWQSEETTDDDAS